MPRRRRRRASPRSSCMAGTFPVRCRPCLLAEPLEGGVIQKEETMSRLMMLVVLMMTQFAQGGPKIGSRTEKGERDKTGTRWVAIDQDDAQAACLQGDTKTISLQAERAGFEP